MIGHLGRFGRRPRRHSLIHRNDSRKCYRLSAPSHHLQPLLTTNTAQRRSSGNKAVTNLDLENHGHLLVRVRFLTGGITNR